MRKSWYDRGYDLFTKDHALPDTIYTDLDPDEIEDDEMADFLQGWSEAFRDFWSEI